jgi:hypothetical protein
MSGNTTLRIVAASTFALALSCGCAEKSPQQSTAATRDSTQQSTSQASIQATPNKSVRVYIDPKTGELRDPTPAELAAEAAAEAQKKQAEAANPQAEQPQTRETITPSGASEITLDKSAQRPLRACIAKNGDLKMDHECELDSSGAKR